MCKSTQKQPSDTNRLIFLSFFIIPIRHRKRSLRGTAPRREFKKCSKVPLANNAYSFVTLPCGPPLGEAPARRVFRYASNPPKGKCLTALAFAQTASGTNISFTGQQ